jgi:hypothetical protein
MPSLMTHESCFQLRYPKEQTMLGRRDDVQIVLLEQRKADALLHQPQLVLRKLQVVVQKFNDRIDYHAALHAWR